jgi:ubiquitin C-terminal hydrolase
LKNTSLNRHDDKSELESEPNLDMAINGMENVGGVACWMNSMTQQLGNIPEYV